MPPKSKEPRKSVSFQGAAADHKGKPGPARDESDKKKGSLDAPSLVEAISAAAMPSDGALPTVPSNGAVETLDNSGFVPPLDKHEHRPSGDDGEIVTLESEEQRQSRHDELVDIDELPVDDDGSGRPPICPAPASSHAIPQAGRAVLRPARASQCDLG
jgi:hypothetical protein